MVGAGAAALRLRAAGHGGGGVERHPRASRGAAAGRRPAGRRRAQRSGPGAPLRAGGRLAGGGAQVAAAAAPGPPAKGPLPSFSGSTGGRPSGYSGSGAGRTPSPGRPVRPQQPPRGRAARGGRRDQREPGWEGGYKTAANPDGCGAPRRRRDRFTPSAAT